MEDEWGGPYPTSNAEKETPVRGMEDLRPSKSKKTQESQGCPTSSDTIISARLTRSDNPTHTERDTTKYRIGLPF